jgi:hypothetical protein
VHARQLIADLDTGIAVGCPEERGVASSFASFRPLPASMTASSSPATVTWAWARSMRFHRRKLVYPPMSAISNTERGPP